MVEYNNDLNYVDPTDFVNDSNINLPLGPKGSA